MLLTENKLFQEGFEIIPGKIRDIANGFVKEYKQVKDIYSVIESYKLRIAMENEERSNFGQIEVIIQENTDIKANIKIYFKSDELTPKLIEEFIKLDKLFKDTYEIPF